MNRKPWLAAILNLLMPGLGQLYCGYLTRGIVLFIVTIVVMNIALAAFVFIEVPPLNVILMALIALSMWIFLIFNGYMTARKVRSEFTPRPFNKWYLYLILTIVWSFTATFLIPVFGNYKSYTIPASSMENTLMIGDYLLADMNAYESRSPEPGDMVIYLFPGDLQTSYIKRCVAGPGDTVSIENKKLFVNGVRFPDEEFTKYIDSTKDGLPKIQPRREGGKDSRDNFGPYLVPDNSYFMLGDSRDNSFDSRYYGSVHKDLILGKLVRIYWSSNFDRIGIRPP